MSKLLAISFICEPITRKGKDTLDNHWLLIRGNSSDFFDKLRVALKYDEEKMDVTRDLATVQKGKIEGTIMCLGDTAHGWCQIITVT